VKKVFLSTRESVEKGDFSGLMELHGMSSGLKSLCTDLAAGGIEICRRAMGGHGYGGYSGLVQLNADYLSKPTVEGDNWMITQQVASYLSKTAKMVVSSPKTTAGNRTESNLRNFWNKQDGERPDMLDNDTATVEAFGHRVAYLVSPTYPNSLQDLTPERHSNYITTARFFTSPGMTFSLKCINSPTV
jgi:acyl-CoA oxidase